MPPTYDNVKEEMKKGYDEEMWTWPRIWFVVGGIVVVSIILIWRGEF